MKKKYLGIPIVILILIVILIFVFNHKSLKIDFNTDLRLSNISSNTLSSLTNSEYEIDDIDTIELDLETEEKIIDLVYNITNSFNDIENDDYVYNIEKYTLRMPSFRIGYYYTLQSSDEYKEWMDNTIKIEAIAAVLRNRQFVFEEIKEVNITYTSSYRILAQAYIDNFVGYYGKEKVVVDAIFEYEIVYEESSSLYKVKRVDTEWVSDLEDYYSENDTNERKQNKSDNNALSNVSSYIPDGYTNFDYTKLESVTEQETTSIYNKNKDSVVIIDSSSDNGVATGSSSGFFIRSGIVVTTYDSLLNMMNNGASHYYAVDMNDNVYEIEGVVASYSSINVVILKLKEEIGVGVTIGDSSTLEDNDPVLSISSSLGLKASIKLGIYFDTMDDDYKILRTSLPLIDGDSGSALFNMNGEVIGINTSVSSSSSSYNSGLNNATDISILKTVIEYIDSQDFSSIDSVSLSSLNEESSHEEVNKVSTKTWNKYLELPVITNYFALDLYSAYTSGNYITVRYKESGYSLMDNDTIISLYGEYLVDNNYTKMDNNTYCLDDVTIRIKNNLGFIIVIVNGV